MGPKKCKSVFTDEVEFLLIDLVERRPLLWDSTIEMDRRADLKRPVWAEIASILGPEFTVDMVMARWKSIKETFQDNLNRVKESKRRSSGNGADDGYKPRWKLWPKTCVTTDSVSNIPMTQESILMTKESEQNSACEKSLTYCNETLQKFVVMPEDESLSVTDLGEMTSPSPTSPLVVKPGPSSAPEVISFFTSGIPRPSSAPSASVVGESEEPNSSGASMQASSQKSSSGELFTKRGSAKKKSGPAMEEALQIIKDMSKEPEPQTDAVDDFVSFMASRLRSMDGASRKCCEDQLMSVLMKF